MRKLVHPYLDDEKGIRCKTGAVPAAVIFNKACTDVSLFQLHEMGRPYKSRREPEDLPASQYAFGNKSDGWHT